MWLSLQGRKILMDSDEQALVHHQASMLEQIDMLVCIRPATDACREEIAGQLLCWLRDMCDVVIGNDDELFKRILARAILAPRTTSSPYGHGTPLASEFDELCALQQRKGQQPTRLWWLMELDSRLWKGPRWAMRDIYSMMYCLGGDIQRDVGGF